MFIVRCDDDDDERTLKMGEELNSLLFDNMWFGALIRRDLLLLENQLPYFIVKHLLDTLSKPGWDNFRLQKAIISSFIGFLPDNAYIPQQRQFEQELQVDHFLHLFHKWLTNIPKLGNPGNRRSCWQLPSKLLCSPLSSAINKTRHCLSKVLPSKLLCSPLSSAINKTRHRLSKVLPSKLLCSPLSLAINKTRHCLSKVLSCCNNPLPSEKSRRIAPTVTELAEAGVNIKVRKANIFLDISFCKDRGELGIPAIDVNDYTNFIFANLIALEQCCRKHGLDVTHYTRFLDDIINTSRDVQLLNQGGIICPSLGDDESIASLFNKIGEGVAYSTRLNYLKDVYKDPNTYCQSRCHRWRANLVHDYFSNPWAFISLVAAVLLIALTILQAVYAVLGYYKGNQQR